MMTPLVLVFLTLVHCTVGFRVLVLGDWGQETTSSSYPAQLRVATAMGDYLEDNPDVSYIITVGDNFYSNGVTSPISSRFDTSWRDVYWRSEFPVMRNLDWYISVGNHDHTDDFDELNQVAFSYLEPQWILPELWHDWYTEMDGCKVHFVVVDTQSLRRRKHGGLDQVTWLEETLASSTGDYVVVIGHHPPLNAGYHGGSGTIQKYIIPVLERFNADVFIFGHDHNLQHINSQQYGNLDHPVDYYLSGGGGRRLYPLNNNNLGKVRDLGYELRHFSEDYGFVIMDFGPQEMKTEFYTVDNNSRSSLVYTHRRPVEL